MIQQLAPACSETIFIILLAVWTVFTCVMSLRLDSADANGGLKRAKRSPSLETRSLVWWLDLVGIGCCFFSFLAFICICLPYGPYLNLVTIESMLKNYTSITYIIYHISYIIYHISYIIYHISYIIYISHIYIYIYVYIYKSYVTITLVNDSHGVSRGCSPPLRLHALDVMTQLVTSGQLIKTLARSCRGHLDIAGT